ncbi:MAG: M14 family zinc carboxypeptidase [Bacteroidota bacterium]|nr:M14 family zinc carboxypeptidase [Bacteroidota bacterium]
MRKLITVFVLLISLSISAQTEKYHRVKIYTGEKGITELSKAGIAVDHGEFKKGLYIITDLSDTEIKAVKKINLPYDVLIEDVGNFYAHQNDAFKNYNPKNETMSAGSCNSCQQFETPQNFNLGSMGGFFTYQEMLDILDSMAAKFPNLITIKDSIGTYLTDEGRPLHYVKISDNPTISETEPQVLYTALHHAREAESLSQLIFYMWYLLENYSTDAEVQYLINNTEMYFIPCVNPDGYVYNESTNPNGGGMWRKNRHDNGDGTFGVDLNRNYGEHWGYDDNGSSPDPVDDTYRGTSGFSEIETQAVRDFCNDHQFKLALNNHTYSNLLIYPWGYIASFQTPDSLLFSAYAKRMTKCSGFMYGTGDQTVGYLVNGDSDDWMYGEQTSKPKILSMTPEAGNSSDGFWPVITRIIDIAKVTMDQNLGLARFSAAYAEAQTTNDNFITSNSSYINYDVTRLGLSPSNVIVYFTPLTPNIATGTGAFVHTGMTLLETKTDSIALTLTGSLAQGEIVQYIIGVSNGFYTINDTITRVYGQPVNAFYDNCNSTAAFVAGGWGVSTSQFVTAMGSIADSPTGFYQNNANKSITTTNFIDLSNALAATLSFNSKWDIEKGYDYVEVLVSTDGTNFTQLCGKYTIEGSDNQNNGLPLYDGRQTTWVKESINLSGYIGMNIKLRFKLVSDGFATGDGFYIDELSVLKIINNIGLEEYKSNVSLLQNSPNPCSDITSIQYNLPDNKGNYSLEVIDELGKIVLKQAINSTVSQTNLDISKFKNGVYYYKITSDKKSSMVKSLVVIH